MAHALVCKLRGSLHQPLKPLNLPAGAAIAEHILESSYFKSSKRLGVYLHCAALRECDTTLLVDTVLQRGVQISHLLTYGGTLLSGCGFQQYQIVLKLCFTLQAMKDVMFLWFWTKPPTCACCILVRTTCPVVPCCSIS